MSKRHQREEGTSLDERRPRKSPSFKSVVLQVMSLCKLQNLMAPVMEPMIRKVVKEEVDTALKKYITSMKRNCGKDVYHSDSEPMSLQLQFRKAVSLPVFTGTRIEGEGHTSLEVALINSVNGQVVSSGLWSSAKVEVLVLEGDFDGDEKENWTLEEFRSNMVRAREGKKALLSGDVILDLNDGLGSVGNIMFTDNSSWTRSRKFRLGARLLDNLGDIRVREARSEPFVVRDHRGELYKKHHPPALGDEVWRLEKIGKDGAFHKRLRKERINTVQDFLMLLFMDPTRLRNILGTGMSAKMWEVTVEHARTCVLDNKLYSYGTLETKGVVFNVVGQVTGIFLNGLFVPFDKLSEPEKAEARELVITAFRDREKIITFEDEPSQEDIHDSSGLPVVDQSPNLPPDVTHPDYLTSHKIGPSTYLQQSPSLPYYLQSGFDDCLSDMDPVAGLRPDQHMGFSGQVLEGLMCDTESMDADHNVTFNFIHFFYQNNVTKSNTNSHLFNRCLSSLEGDRSEDLLGGDDGGADEDDVRVLLTEDVQIGEEEGAANRLSGGILVGSGVGVDGVSLLYERPRQELAEVPEADDGDFELDGLGELGDEFSLIVKRLCGINCADTEASAK